MASARQIGVANLPFLEALFEPLVENPFFVKNDRLQYVAANTAMLRLLGVSHRKQLLGRTAREVFPVHAALHHEGFERRVLAGKPVQDRLELIEVKGKPAMWLLFSEFPLRDAAGKIVGIAGVSRQLDLRRAPAYARLATAIGLIRENLDRPLDLPRICARAKMSASQLERDFRKLLRASPRQYQQRVRIERAIALLADDKPVTAVAQACGFSDHSAFTRRFRDLVGMTPSAYRRQLAGEA